MKIDEALLERLENLSHLTIPNEKRSEIIEQLSEFLEFSENLSELDTKDIESTFNMRDSKTHLRSDLASSKKEIATSILDNSPSSENSFFIVPNIIE